MRARLAAIALLVSIAVSAQQLPTVFRSAIDLVEVDVVVYDKDGRFVGDLTPDDFTIEEAGKAREIEQFYLHAGGRIMPGAAGAPSDATTGRTTSRVFIVVFDDVHLTSSGFKRTQAAALALFSQQFRPGDIGGVVIRGRMVSDRLTSDREELLKAVKNAKPDATKSSRLFDERTFPRLSEVEAVRIVFNADRPVLEDAVRRACRDDEDLCRRVDPTPAVQSKASQLAEVARAESARTLQVLRTLADGLSRFDGRKTILLMSEGFLAEDSWPLVEEVVAAAARANARLYTLDARGLERNLASIADSAPGIDSGSARLLQQMDFGADSINSLAVDSGGFAIRNTNLFDKAIARIADDVNNYYVLGYRPLGPADGKFHRIAVKVRRPGVSVRARRGYVATPGSAPLTTATAAASTASTMTAVAAPVTGAISEPSATQIAATATPSATTPASTPAASNAASIGSAAGAAAATSAAPSSVSSVGASDPAVASAVIVPRGSNTSGGFRVRPDAEAHANSLASSEVTDADASAGWDAYQRGDVELARDKLAAAAARGATHAWVHYTLGMATYALGQFRDAAASWERVRTASADFQPVYFDLIDAYLQLKEHDRAIRVARAGLDRWPQDAELFEALGVVQTTRGSLDDAIKSFQAAVAIAPADPTGHFNLAKAFEMRYYKSRRYLAQLQRWVSNEADRQAAVEGYERYIALRGPYADAARDGLTRLKWVPAPK